MEQIFTNQIAWVTGGASGIGKAIAVRLADQGAQVLVLDYDKDGLLLLSKEARFETCFCNVADVDSVNAIFDEVAENFREPQIVVNAAGIQASHSIVDYKDDTWQKVLDINLNGPFHIIRAVLSGMMDRGYGRVINIASGTAVRLSAGASAYGSSKAGLIALTKTTALESAARGVTANAVAPGLVDTPMTRSFGSRAELEMMAQDSNLANPMGRVLSPEDIAHAVAFLADPKSSAITGQVLHVNAGSIML